MPSKRSGKHFRIFEWSLARCGKPSVSPSAIDGIGRDELKEADDPEAAKNEFVDQYREKFANPYVAAEYGYVDDVIKPSETRERLIRGFDMLEDKVVNNPPKKHGNVPL